MEETLMEKAIRLVQNYVEEKEKTSNFETKLVWFSKTLKNWKSLVITDLDDEMYYEVTYNGDKEETYLDAYTKVENVRIPD